MIAREPDLTLTLSVLAPCLVVAAGFVLAWWVNRQTPKPRRLTAAEVGRLCGVTAEKARQGQWN